MLEGETIFCCGLSHPWDPAPDGCVITFISTNNPLLPKQRERVHQTSPRCCNNDKNGKGEYIQVTLVSFQKTTLASQSRLSADFFWGKNPKIYGSMPQIAIFWASKTIREEKRFEMMIWQLVEWCWLDLWRPKVVGSGGNLPVGRRQARGQHSGWFCYSLSSLMLLLLSFFVILCHHCCHYLYHHHRCQSAGDQRASLKFVLVVILCHHCYHHLWRPQE